MSTTRYSRMPIIQSEFGDELYKLRDVTVKLVECYDLYRKHYDQLTYEKRQEIDYFIHMIHQEIQDTPTHPMPMLHLGKLHAELCRGIVWLYITMDTYELEAVNAPRYVPEYLDVLFASMRTEPELPAITIEKKKKKGATHAE